MKCTAQVSAANDLSSAALGHEPVLEISTGPVLVIQKEVAQACASQFAGALHAVVLTGSLARGEGSFLSEAGVQKFYGDAEFIILIQGRVALPNEAVIDSLKVEIETTLRKRGVECSISLSAAHSDYLRKMQPSIFAYELRTWGRSIWGSEVLSLIPAFTPASIPLEDAWRLLANRMIEQLERAAEIQSDSSFLPPGLYYRTAKLYLDMATSLLVFIGAYEPSYQRRAARLLDIAARPGSLSDAPFPLVEFARTVAACTAWKLAPNTRTFTDEDWKFWTTAISHAELLWRWELAQLSRSSRHLSATDLMNSWIKQQPMTARWRGWMYVVRKQRWLTSWLHWPTWARQVLRMSPRYCVYSATGELFPMLPELLRPPNDMRREKPDWERIRHRLPLRLAMEQEALWCQLAAEISWNYHEFLEGTVA